MDSYKTLEINNSPQSKSTFTDNERYDLQSNDIKYYCLHAESDLDHCTFYQVPQYHCWSDRKLEERGGAQSSVQNLVPPVNTAIHGGQTESW